MRRLGDAALPARIRAIHAELKGEYGRPHMRKELPARGIRVGKDRARKLMRQRGIRAKIQRKCVVTTDGRRSLPAAPAVGAAALQSARAQQASAR